MEREAAAKEGVAWSTRTSSHLALFYARAKQTFLTPNAEYELNLSSRVLAPFHASSGSVSHPDPAFFTQVVIETRKMLEESLRRFVIAQLNNVGNNRVLCGIIVGTLITLVGTIPLLTVNLVLGQVRWLRLAAIPPLWLGLTAVMCALHGICVGVYVLGDLRQLRRFELARPAVSKPELLQTAPQQSLMQQVGIPPMPIIPPPVPVRVNRCRPVDRLSSIASMSSVDSFSSVQSSLSLGSTSRPSVQEVIIEISPAIPDLDPVDGPATDPMLRQQSYESAPTKPVEPPPDDSDENTATASFIHPFESGKDFDSVNLDCIPEEHQPISTFDFDALPPKSRIAGSERSTKHTHPSVDTQDQVGHADPSLNSQATVIARLQERCNMKRRSFVTGASQSEEEYLHNGSSGSSLPKFYSPAYAQHWTDDKYEEQVRKRFRKMNSVPVFAAPLTRVLSPVIRRGQWEIVIRSVTLSLLFSWVLIGSLVAIPVLRR
ncbi:hypothetical protein AX17_005028 [Amanita inopinata Kibby_2008]|nr:hypothetical protein AX17_005028 [Amanita inopinata Kibby_2008]